MRELGYIERQISFYRSLIPEISFENVETIISDDCLHDVLNSVYFISCPEIAIFFVVDVLKAHNLSFDFAFYYGTSISFNLFFDTLSYSLVSCIVEDLYLKLKKTSYCLVRPLFFSFDKDKIVFSFNINKRV